MSALNTLEGLVAGVWLGAYLFTTFIVSPALKSLPFTDAERIRVRSTIGRRYGKLAGPLLLVWLALLLLEGFTGRFTPWTFLRLGLLVLLTAAVGVHGYLIGSRMQALSERESAEPGVAISQERAKLQRLSARVTPVALIASLTLAIAALV